MGKGLSDDIASHNLLFLFFIIIIFILFLGIFCKKIRLFFKSTLTCIF